MRKNTSLLFSEYACTTDCVANLWNQECRDCLFNDLWYGPWPTYSGCHLCDDECGW